MELDSQWIRDFEETDELYSDFYTEQLESVRLFVLYVDKRNKLFHTKKELITLENGVISKENLIGILKQYMTYNNKKYRPISIMKWNIDLLPEEITKYLKNQEKYNFLSIEEKIEDIKFDDSVTLFHDINSLYIVFHRSWESYKNRTKKIYINKRKLKGRRRKTKRI